VRRIAQDNGITSWSESGFDRSVVFSNGSRSTSIPMQADLETFHPSAVIRLIQYFAETLSKNKFWPQNAESTGA
jgi:hypothetical protein